MRNTGSAKVAVTLLITYEYVPLLRESSILKRANSILWLTPEEVKKSTKDCC